MAYSQEQWKIVRAYFEEGFSLAEIVARHNVDIKDRSSISRRATKEGWIKGENATLTDTEVQIKQMTALVVEKKATMNATALDIHNSIVDERTKHIQFFNDAALTNVRDSLAAPCESQMDFKARAETISKGREVVLGKTPDTAIQINNNQQTRSINPENLTLDQKRAIASITING